MRKDLSFWLVITSALFLFESCHKKENNQQLSCPNPHQPAAYFPAYPKSWWDYKDNNGNKVSYRISLNYENCENACRPVFLNANKCIDGSNIITRLYIGLGETHVFSSPIYSLVKDSVLNCVYSFSTLHDPGIIVSGGGDYRRETLALDSSITLSTGEAFSHVIQVYEYDVNDSTHRYLDYFARDVGLIKRDSISAIDSTQQINILTLDSYYVNN